MRVIKAFSLVVLIGIAAVGLTVSDARATLLSVGSEFGPNTITRDEDKGLDWLDFSFSVNRSYNDLIGLDGSNEFALGGDYFGFRYATETDVLGLWNTAGINTYNIALPELVGPVSTLTNLFGNTWTPNFGFTGFIAITSTLKEGNVCGPGCTARVTPEIRLGLHFNPPILAGSAINVQALRDDIAEEIYGNYLVRDTPAVIPLPAALPLFGTGLALIGFLGWRRKRKAVA